MSKLTCSRRAVQRDAAAGLLAIGARPPISSARSADRTVRRSPPPALRRRIKHFWLIIWRTSPTMPATFTASPNDYLEDVASRSAAEDYFGTGHFARTTTSSMVSGPAPPSGHSILLSGRGPSTSAATPRIVATGANAASRSASKLRPTRSPISERNQRLTYPTNSPTLFKTARRRRRT